MQGSSSRNLDEMVENFSLFSDWEERYRYLIDLGRTLPEMDNTLKTDENLVQGCTSRVWMVAETRDGKFHFTADSDAHIVRGLIALLAVAYQDKPVAELTGIDVEGAFKKIGLDQNLSPNRRNGFFAMVERIKALAEN
ncbi:MAG: SufE family protein [Alphaproteobacteria bacterium PRO2]|nr:SufE family protein [Alphaproteobacteria bacterium PRO2]